MYLFEEFGVGRVVVSRAGPVVLLARRLSGRGGLLRRGFGLTVDRRPCGCAEQTHRGAQDHGDRPAVYSRTAGQPGHGGRGGCRSLDRVLSGVQKKCNDFTDGGDSDNGDGYNRHVRWLYKNIVYNIQKYCIVYNTVCRCYLDGINQYTGAVWRCVGGFYMAVRRDRDYRVRTDGAETRARLCERKPTRKEEIDGERKCGRKKKKVGNRIG